MKIVELGFKLNKKYKYYHNMLILKKFKKVFSCKTRDIYWTKENLDNKTENEIKNACVRLRITSKINILNLKKSYQFQNLDKLLNNQKKLTIKETIKLLESSGYKKVFDTSKKDYHYQKDDMKSRIQLQKIKNIGLLLYYDNPDYYELSLEGQREKLINELNNYGFNFKLNELCLDKLRTLYYHENKYSKNVNE